jgi:hypothetical protein
MAFEEEVLARKMWLYLEVDFLGELNRKVFVCGDSIMIIACKIDSFIELFKKSSWTQSIYIMFKTLKNK